MGCSNLWKQRNKKIKTQKTRQKMSTANSQWQDVRSYVWSWPLETYYKTNIEGVIAYVDLLSRSLLLLVILLRTKDNWHWNVEMGFLKKEEHRTRCSSKKVFLFKFHLATNFEKWLSSYKNIRNTFYYFYWFSWIISSI